jgi:hypothetical protein
LELIYLELPLGSTYPVIFLLRQLWPSLQAMSIRTQDTVPRSYPG